MRLPALACLGALLLAIPAHAQDSGEIAFWESVKDSKNPAELQAYLDAYPQGKFAVLARLRIGELGGVPQGRPIAGAPAAPPSQTPGTNPAASGSGAPAAEAAPAPSTRTPAPAPAGEIPAGAARWQEFRSAGGSFAAQFPGEPKQNVNPPDENGHSQHRYVVAQGDTAFIISYDDYAPGRMVADADMVLQNAQRALLKAMSGTLRNEQPLTLAGLPGREIIFDMPDHTAGRVRLYVGHNRMYQIWFLGPAGQETGADADRFLGSFELAGTARAEAPAAGGPAAGEATSEQPTTPATGPTAGADHQWHEFRSSKAGFVVQFPGEPKVDANPPEADGRSETRYTIDLGDTAYIVAVDEYAPGKLTNANPMVLLDSAQGAVLKGLNGTLRQRRAVTVSGFPGREILFDTADHNTGKVRVYVVRNRLYQTWYLGPSGQETRPDVDRFLNSFRVSSQ
ncbi:MAG: hypothetical protein JO047_04960 [Alphaproteobacteria bacterium]|nr:hypothetical protein [Alphaproteobacteria bacterium]